MRFVESDQLVRKLSSEGVDLLYFNLFVEVMMTGDQEGGRRGKSKKPYQMARLAPAAIKGGTVNAVNARNMLGHSFLPIAVDRVAKTAGVSGYCVLGTCKARARSHRQEKPKRINLFLTF